MTKTENNRVEINRRDLIALRHVGESLSLKTGRINSRQSGQYLSRFKGRGMEFDESRLYQPGDDMRTLDWRVMARTGVAHTKLFREERERAVLAWVDLRPSMFFATQGMFKSVVAAHAAALAAWAANKQGDRLGGLIFSASTHHELRPARGKSAVLHLLRQLVEIPQRRAADSDTSPQSAANALARLRRVAKPGSLIFLFSDFRHPGQQAESHIMQLARHNDVVIVFIYDPLEAELPADGLYRVAWENKTVTFSSTGENRRDYHEHFQAHREYLQKLSRLPGVHYLECATHDDVAARLQEGLGRVG